VEADVVSRTYRLAVSATGEYTQKHNGTVEGALAAINTALNRINFVLESEVAVSLELIEPPEKGAHIQHLVPYHFRRILQVSRFYPKRHQFLRRL